MNKKTINNNNSTSSTSNTSDIIATRNDTPPSLAPSSSSSSSQFTPPSNNNNDTLYTDYADNSRGGLGLAVVMLFAISSMIGNWYIQKRKIENEDNNSTTNNVHLSSTGRTTAMGSNIQLLSHENCIELYNKTFDSNGNQLILQQKHIVTRTTKGNNNDNGNDNDNGKSNDNGNNTNTNTNTGSGTEGVVEQKIRSESFVDIELGGDDNGGNCNGNGNGNGNGNDDSSSIYLSFESDRNKLNQLDWSSSNRSSIITTSTKNVHLDHKGEKNITTTNMINNGTCIICLEEFVKEDMIVWSNDSACNHIYHKECMVHYLAKNCTQRKKGTTNCVLDLITYDNPCPICRRPNYCLESDDELVQILSLLSSIQPQSSTATTTPITSIGNSSNDDDDDDNDETLDEVAVAVAVAAVVIETTTNEE